MSAQQSIKSAFFLLLFLTAACTHSPDPRPHQVADAFLTAYFGVDFEQLLPLCATGSELKSDMERNARAIGAERRLADLAAYSFRIDDVQLNCTKDSAFVSYFLFAPEIPDGIASRLTLIKENNDWRIAKLL